MNWMGGAVRGGLGGQGRVAGPGRGRGLGRNLHAQLASRSANPNGEEKEGENCEVLEMAKYLPQGHALYIQLYHQMEIHKPRHPPPQQVAFSLLSLFIHLCSHFLTFISFSPLHNYNGFCFYIFLNSGTGKLV